MSWVRDELRILRRIYLRRGEPRDGNYLGGGGVGFNTSCGGSFLVAQPLPS